MCINFCKTKLLFISYLDFVNVMTYDMHGSWESFLGLNAPLYSRSDETDEQAQLNDAYVNEFIINNKKWFRKKFLNIKKTVLKVINYYLSNGNFFNPNLKYLIYKCLIIIELSASKINFGMATYGRTFTMSDSNQSGLGSPALYAGNAGVV